MIDEQSSASGHDYASYRSAIGDGTKNNSDIRFFYTCHPAYLEISEIYPKIQLFTKSEPKNFTMYNK